MLKTPRALGLVNANSVAVTGQSDRYPLHCLNCQEHSRFAGNSRNRLFGCALCENPLQRAAMHVETSRRLRHVTPAQFVDALDVLPPDPVG
jgi:hypothetical protein